MPRALWTGTISFGLVAAKARASQQGLAPLTARSGDRAAKLTVDTGVAAHV